MTLLGKPVPPLDHVPHAKGAPPGVGVDIDFYHQWDGTTPLPGTKWYATRSIISPVAIVVHTNAASVESTLQASKNWGNRAVNNTKPHYNFNAPRPEKNVPTDRRAIANSTGSTIEDQYKCPDSSFWALAIESADRGYKASTQAPDGSGVDLGPFMYDHDELLARVLAYEAIVHKIPLTIPTAFYTPGVYTHTSPWGYPHLTTQKGKTCPTFTKKRQILDSASEIMARAREIYSVWTGSQPIPPLPEVPFDPANGEYGLWPLNANKPILVLDSMGDAVKYLQGVLRNKAGQQVAVDGDFGPQTLTAVKNFQAYAGLPTQYNSVDADDWPVLDALVSKNVTPEPEPTPPPVVTPPPPPPVTPPPPTTPPYVSVGTGRYYLEAGGNPWRVSMNVYGNDDMVDELQAVNPGTWFPGQLIKCPDVIGRTKQVESGQGALAILRQFFPNDNPYDHLDDFYFWNGGKDRALKVGDWVYCSINWENPNG